MLVEYDCAVCGSHVAKNRSPSTMLTNPKYCSNKCKGIGQRGQNIEHNSNPISTACRFCGSEIKDKRPRQYCNTQCKAKWQRTQKPATREWLYQKYIVEQLSADDIAIIVGRNPKRVWEWLRDYDIPTRSRGAPTNGSGFKPGHRMNQGRRISDHQKETIRQARLRDGRIPALINGVHWMKHYGRKPASWKGGVSPERQAFYATEKWRQVVKIVWQRDNAMCQHCLLDSRTLKIEERHFHIHHIHSFMIVERRADPDNLVLLCERCHRWVHSRGNTKGVFLGEGH